MSVREWNALTQADLQCSKPAVRRIGISRAVAQPEAQLVCSAAERWRDPSIANLYPLWRESLPVLASRPRSHLLTDLRALQPVILPLGGEAAAAETAQAILDVGRWWP